MLLLFPYHTFMIFNSFGESYYIKGADLKVTSSFITALWPWIMPLLFAIAGASSAYALNKRTPYQYLKEQVAKLFIPLLFGLLFIMPAMTYFTERFHNGYMGGYFEQYILFFTKPTDLTGYQGGFTPGHLWFILYLFITLLALPIMVLSKKKSFSLNTHKWPSPFILLLFCVPLILRPLLDISGKSVTEYFAFFMLGYFVLSNEDIIEKTAKNRLLLSGLFLVGMAFVVTAFIVRPNINPLLYDIITELYAWGGILALLGLGRCYLNINNKITDYLSASSFSVYLFHHLWIVVVAYYVFGFTESSSIQIILILLCSIPLTFLTYEILKRFGITRWIFRLRK